MKYNVTEVEFDFDDDYAEEFIFQCETPEEFQRIHLDDDYLKINWRLD